MAETRTLEARRTVGRVLLYRMTPKGGTSGYGIDEARAEELLPTLDADGFYNLLLEVAREAAQDAEREADFQVRGILRDIEQIAERTNSLRLYRYTKSRKKA
jgi:hypothetical protein